ncbi:hypothetical protein N0572_22025 [Pseudomonas aeruginosa]|nr:hypothetical protein [Pseudomonas aeruginosa]MCT0241003.1 hypothetical protein [Pseudomonas aeruginosa]
MDKEVHDLLATAAADYRARGDLKTAARFDAACVSSVQTGVVLEQPSESERYEEFERALVLLQNRAAIEPKRVAWELWQLVRSQHDLAVGALTSAHRKHAAELITSRGLLRDELESSKARVAELEADLLRSAEGTDILGGLIASIEKHGNYSAESTVVFLRQALGCFNRFSPVSDAPAKGEVSRDE